MTFKSPLTVVIGLLAVAFVALFLYTATSQDSRAQPAAAPKPAASAARTSFPGLTAAKGEPDLPGLEAVHPTPAQVLQVPGPFDDRLALEELAFTGSAVTGTVRITSDVSEVLDLQVLAGFYDAQGKLLGTAQFVHHTGAEGHNHSGPPEQRENFTVSVPDDLKGRAVSAGVGVPVLVNE